MAGYKIGVLMSDGTTLVFDIGAPDEDVRLHKSGALSIRAGDEMHTFAPGTWRRTCVVSSDVTPERFFEV